MKTKIIEEQGKPYALEGIRVYYTIKSGRKQSQGGCWEFILVQPHEGDNWLIVNYGEG